MKLNRQELHEFKRTLDFLSKQLRKWEASRDELSKSHNLYDLEVESLGSMLCETTKLQTYRLIASNLNLACECVEKIISDILFAAKVDKINSEPEEEEDDSNRD